MKFSVDRYIDEKINHMIKSFEKRFIRAQMRQALNISSAISKKILKAEEGKIRYRNLYTSRMEDKTMKEIIDKDEIFNLVLSIVE